MSRIKRIIISAMAALGLLIPAAVPAIASAQDVNQNLNCGAQLQFNTTNAECASDGEDAGTQVDNIVTNIVNIVSLIVGIAAVMMIIIAGLRYITSGGDSGKIGGAKDTIIYAIIGLVVVALAQLIVRFVVDRTTEGAA